VSVADVTDRRADGTRGGGVAPRRPGLSNKQIGLRLVISAKTAGNHVEHIYTKIAVTSRAEAGLFAMEHGLLLEEDAAFS
jgi:hypothetical protein